MGCVQKVNVSSLGKPIVPRHFHTLSKSDYINNFSHYRKTVSLICSLCLCVMVSAYIIWYRVHTWASRVNARSCFLWSSVYIFTNNIHASINNSSPEGAC